MFRIKKRRKKMGKFTLKIVELLQPRIPSNMIPYYGRIRIVSPIEIVKGATVITPDGIGEITSIVRDDYKDRPNTVAVLLYRGYVKHYKVLHLHQYVVFHKRSGQFVLLSPSCYRYVYEDGQPVQYRVTKRHYALLTENSKEEYEYIKTLNRQRHGHELLNQLRKKNFFIVKKK